MDCAFGFKNKKRNQALYSPHFYNLAVQPILHNMKSHHIFFALILILCSQCNNNNEQFQDGDIIFQLSKSAQSKAIELAMDSKYNHMGIIYKQDDAYFVYEAVQPVKLTPLQEWIDRGVERHYVVKRLKKAGTYLTPDNLAKMKQIGEQYKGKDYDNYFEWSDNRMYCSELVWKIYNQATGLEIGQPKKLGDLDLSHDVVQTHIHERYGDEVPMDEPVISPATMLRSDKLTTVFGDEVLIYEVYKLL